MRLLLLLAPCGLLFALWRGPYEALRVYHEPGYTFMGAAGFVAIFWMGIKLWPKK